MSAQRNPRSSQPRSGQASKPEHASQRGQNDWEQVKGKDGAHGQADAGPRTPTSHPVNPKHDEVQRQNQSSWNTRQDPEHPERPADGGQTEMRSQREMSGNSGSTEPQRRKPNSPEKPESGDRGRDPSDGRRMES